MNKCYFDKPNNYCSALTVKKCDGCKFRKTEKEYNAAVEHAKEILKAKRLIVVERYVDGINCISTERV